MTRCMASSNGQPFGERCGQPATWICPSGPRCDACAEREKKAILDGACILAIAADARGVPRSTLLQRYRKLS